MRLGYFSLLFRKSRRVLLPIIIGLCVILCCRLILFKLSFTILNFIHYEVITVKDIFQSVEKVETKRELVLLQLVFRHGLRTPVTIPKKDPYPKSTFVEGLGQLSKIGRLQNYKMGLHLQERYQSFITTSHKEVELLVSEATRTHHGAYAFISGLYAPSEENRFTNEIRWQPIAASNPNHEDKKVLTRRYCASGSSAYLNFYYSQMANDTYKKFESLYKYISYHSGRTVKHVLAASDISKTLRIEQKYNLTVPDWALKIWKELHFQSGLSYYFQNAAKSLIRYRLGPLLKYMVERIKEKVNNLIPEKKVFAYSSHGSCLAQILLLLKEFNFIEPHESSTIALELWKENRKFSVRWLYFNSTDPDIRIDPPTILRVQDCGEEFCPLETFLNITNNFIPDDWLEECKNSSLGPSFDPLERFCDPPPIYLSPELLKIVELNTTSTPDPD